MTDSLRVADVAAHLAHTGWRVTGEWRGAAIWTRADDEVLLPGQDDLGDHAQRMRELVRVLEAVEERPAWRIALEITAGDADAAEYALGSGLPSLVAVDRATRGLRTVLTAAGRAVVDGPHSRFAGPAPAPVTALLDGVRAVPAADDRLAMTLLVPAGGDPAGRDVLVQLHDAASAARAALDEDDVEAFDGTVTAGVSADLCAGLGDLGGEQRREPFTLGFRWARTVPSDLPARSVAFPAGAGVVLRAAAGRLRRTESAVEATVVGRVERLHDDGDGDRRRVRVRGEHRVGRVVHPRRAVWLRLDRAADYELAIAAHRDGRAVRAEGTLSSRTGRAELSVPAEALRIVDDDG